MKLLIFILCFGLGFHLCLSHNQKQVKYCKKCPLFDPASGAVNLPGPAKSNFYKCDHGIGVLFNCPAKTHFNPILQVCDWPNRANAVTCKIPPTNLGEGSGDGLRQGFLF